MGRRASRRNQPVKNKMSCPKHSAHSALTPMEYYSLVSVYIKVTKKFFHPFGAFMETLSDIVEYRDGEVYLKKNRHKLRKGDKITKMYFEKRDYNREQIIWVLYNGEYDRAQFRAVEDSSSSIGVSLIPYVTTNGRPAGSKDAKKRKQRTSWTGPEITFVRNNREKMSLNELSKALGRPTGSIAILCKRKFGVKKAFSELISKKIDPKDLFGIGGVYGIVCSGTHKVYIGQSCDCGKRIENHLSQLNAGKHFSKQMQKDFGEFRESFWVGMFERADTKLLELETKYLNSIRDHETYNMYRSLEINKEFADLIDISDRYTIEGDCWIWNGPFCNSGYGKVTKTKMGDFKQFAAHRLSYYKATGEYPPLLRHLCNNRKCINPEHLMDGTHRENALDKNQKIHMLGLS